MRNGGFEANMPFQNTPVFEQVCFENPTLKMLCLAKKYCRFLMLALVIFEMPYYKYISVKKSLI